MAMLNANEMYEVFDLFPEDLFVSVETITDVKKYPATQMEQLFNKFWAEAMTEGEKEEVIESIFIKKKLLPTDCFAFLETFFEMFEAQLEQCVQEHYWSYCRGRYEALAS